MTSKTTQSSPSGETEHLTDIELVQDTPESKGTDPIVGKLTFPPSIIDRYRVTTERLAPGESEQTIKLTGKRGHVYHHSFGWAGVWLNHNSPDRKLTELKAEFPNLIVQQVGMGEATFRLPMADLELLLPRIRASRRPKLSDAQRAAKRDLMIAIRKKKSDQNGPVGAPKALKAPERLSTTENESGRQDDRINWMATR